MNTKLQRKTEQKNRTSRRTKEVNNTCMICNTSFISVRKSKCCSERCRQILRANKKLEKVDHIVCPACNQKVQQITAQHARSHGYENVQAMKQDLNLNTVTCESVKNLNRGENNSGYQHGGKFSKFSKNFIHGYDKDWHEEWAKNHSKFRNNNKELFKTNLEFWISKCSGDVERAKKMYKKFQTRDLTWFIEKYGAQAGAERHQQKIERWAKSMPKFNYSFVSQKLFDQILNGYNNADSDIYYATHYRDDMKKYENKEYRLKTKTSHVMPDFIDLSKKRIIEFDGDYWHSEAKVNPAREKKRHEQIVNAGFEIKYVREHDYKQHSERVIEECLQFLNK